MSAAFGSEGASAPIGFTGSRWPWLSAALLLTFIAVFVIEQRFAVTLGERVPGTKTLVALGRLNWTLAQSGEWYRLLSAPFLHAGLAHLIANGIAFALSGYALERLVGRAWMFCIFAAGALAGSVASLLLSPPSTVSVGASGAIMAMLVALFFISLRLPAGRTKTWIQVHSLRIAVPALIPVSHGAAAMHVDYGAHFGGASLGLALGLLLLRTWPDGSPLPCFRAGATALAAIAGLAFATSAYAVSGRIPVYASAGLMIPAAELPHGTAEIASKAPGLLAAYPSDPRSHAFAGLEKLKQGDKAAAERELRTAVSLAGSSSFITPSSANSMRAMLAVTILYEGRRTEAHAIAHDLCLAKGDAAPFPDLAKILAQSGLCREDATSGR